ncbi:hypothetical protein [Portibacter marinus]|uniref:hypothetical protein n=1 Tax=Portibacter marinus TaxID=2898660 RepID=UPI001F22CFA9|nr:hypothetical protein [Portibacter marinus]
MKYTNTIVFWVFASLSLVGQVTFQPKSLDNEIKGVVYNTEQTVDLRLHANGWAVAYNVGKIVTYNKTTYYQFEIGKHKDPREKLQSRPYNIGFVRGAGSFAYGKINSFYSLRAGMGRLKYLSEKAKRKGIAVGWNYEIGPALGLLKPYYLEVFVDNSDRGSFTTEAIKYTEETREQFLDQGSISNEGRFSEGLFETRLIPGIQGKIGVHFDAGAFDEYVKAIEVGAMAEVYTRRIAMMAPTENHPDKPYFFNLYVNLHFGKRK